MDKEAYILDGEDFYNIPEPLTVEELEQLEQIKQ